MAEVLTCNRCGARVSLAWGGSYHINAFVLICPSDPNNHTNFGRESKAFDRRSIPGWRYTKEEIKELEKALGPRAPIVLAQQGQTAMTDQQAMELVQTYWPTAPPIQQKRAALMCKRYNLDPGLRQIHLMPFRRKDKNGNVVIKDGKEVIDWAIAVGIRATRINTRRNTNFRYINDSPRPATEEEQIKFLGRVDKTRLWFITYLENTTTHEVVFGLGNWPLDSKGVPRKAMAEDKGNTPENMASIRSERAACDKLCPDWLPPGVRVVDEKYVPSPEPQSTICQKEIPDNKKISKKSEVVVEAEIQEMEGLEEYDADVVEDLPDLTLTPGQTPGQTPEKASKLRPVQEWEKVTKDQISNYQALEDKLRDLAGMAPREIYKELGVSGRSDMVDPPWESFLAIKNVYYPKDAPVE